MRGRLFSEEAIATAQIAKPTTTSAAASQTTLNVLLACANRPRPKTRAFRLTKSKPMTIGTIRASCLGVAPKFSLIPPAFCVPDEMAVRR
jgi:hypothetical protein